MSDNRKTVLLINSSEYEDYNIRQRQYVSKKIIQGFVPHMAKNIKTDEVKEIKLILENMNGTEEEETLELDIDINITDKDDIYASIIILDKRIEEDLESKRYTEQFQETTDKLIYTVRIKYDE